MQRRESESRRRIGSVKEAINSYGEKMFEGTSIDSPETSSRTRDLHRARRDIFRFKEGRVAAEDTKAHAESELCDANKTVRDLSAMIEESNSKLKAQMRDRQDQVFVFGNNNDDQYEAVMRELEHIKLELSKLKIDMASVLDDRSQAVKQTQASRSKMQSYLSSAQVLEKEIEEANEEQVIAELARIEALKEYGAIEVHREKEANEFSSAMETTRKKMKDLMEELDQCKELETKLAVTTADVNVLQNEINLVKEMDKRVPESEDAAWPSSALLDAVTEELEAAKKELASINDEGFQFMTSMDIIRNELIHVTQETSRLKKSGEKADLTIQSLNSKLLRAKAKVESASSAEEKARSIASSLSLTLEQLKAEAEASTKEKALIDEETAAIKAEIQKTEAEIDGAEERLEASMQELEGVKLSEAMALESLKSLIENTIQARASASEKSTWITISKFEYDYLTGRATGAEEIADKKVAAAQAWIQALKASEKEMQMRAEMYRKEKSPSAKRVVEGELQLVLPRKARKENSNVTPARRSKIRKAAASPGGRYMGRSTSLTIKQRQKVMPNLTKFFSGRGNEKEF